MRHQHVVVTARVSYQLVVGLVACEIRECGRSERARCRHALSAGK